MCAINSGPRTNEARSSFLFLGICAQRIESLQITEFLDDERLQIFLCDLCEKFDRDRFAKVSRENPVASGPRSNASLRNGSFDSNQFCATAGDNADQTAGRAF